MNHLVIGFAENECIDVGPKESDSTHDGPHQVQAFAFDHDAT